MSSFFWFYKTVLTINVLVLAVYAQDGNHSCSHAAPQQSVEIRPPAGGSW